MKITLLLAGLAAVLVLLWRLAASDFQFGSRFAPKTMRGRYLYLLGAAIWLVILMTVMRFVRGHCRF